MPETTALKEIPVDEIIRNPLNPRLDFNEKKMRILRDSIEKVGVLVPITVFQRSKDGRYCLIDGERRWMCVKRLNRNTIPAVIIPEPKPEANLLRMFTIHHLREKWSLIAVALKLEQLMDMTGIKDTRELSTRTGVSTVKITHCKRILSYAKKYQDILLLADEDERVKPDFFIELYPVLEKTSEALPDFYEKHPRDHVIDILIEKFRNGKISAAREFRNLRRLLENVESGKIPRETAKKFLIRLVENPDTTIGEIFRELDIEYPTELDRTTRICDSLTRSLSRIETRGIKRNTSFLRSLQKLRKQIDRLLSVDTR